MRFLSPVFQNFQARPREILSICACNSSLRVGKEAFCLSNSERSCLFRSCFSFFLRFHSGLLNFFDSVEIFILFSFSDFPNFKDGIDIESLVAFVSYYGNGMTPFFALWKCCNICCGRAVIFLERDQEFFSLDQLFQKIFYIFGGKKVFHFSFPVQRSHGTNRGTTRHSTLSHTSDRMSTPQA